jgi:hypothetical protein
LEFVAKLGGDYAIYAQVNIQSRDWAARKDVWLKFQVGNSQPLPFDDGSGEWTIYLKPKPLGDEWALFHVNLADEVERTFGVKGWKLRKLRGFRLRGNLQMAYIKVF